MKEARIAGRWYLAMALLGPIGILWAPSQLRTAADLVNHAQVARIGVFASLLCQVTFVFLLLALERTFAGVDDKLVQLMRAFVIAGVAVAAVNEMFMLAAVEMKEPALLRVHEQGILIVCGLFWGLWLFPFGRLVMKSGFMPRWIGVFLIIGGSGYLVDASLALLAPVVHTKITELLMLPLGFGELAAVGWLLLHRPKEG